MSYLNKRRRTNINIINKQQQWRSFSVDDIKINKQNKINNRVISGYDQIKNTHRFNETVLRQAYKKPGDWTATSGDKMDVAGSQTEKIGMMTSRKYPFGVI